MKKSRFLSIGFTFLAFGAMVCNLTAQDAEQPAVQMESEIDQLDAEIKKLKAQLKKLKERVQAQRAQIQPGAEVDTEDSAPNRWKKNIVVVGPDGEIDVEELHNNFFKDFEVIIPNLEKLKMIEGLDDIEVTVPKIQQLKMIKGLDGQIRIQMEDANKQLEKARKLMKERFKSDDFEIATTNSTIISIEDDLKITVVDKNGKRKISVVKDGETIAEDLDWAKRETLPKDIRQKVEALKVPGHRTSIVFPRFGETDEDGRMKVEYKRVKKLKEKIKRDEVEKDSENDGDPDER